MLPLMHDTVDYVFSAGAISVTFGFICQYLQSQEIAFYSYFMIFILVQNFI